MKIQAVIAVAIVGAAVSGCATIIKGTSQDIAVTTSPANGVDCVLNNSEGTWYLTTPGNAHVHKTKNDITITCKKNGFQDAQQIIPSHFNGATAGNILAGGLIGIGVDAASGANYTYPDTTEVSLVPVQSAAHEAPMTPVSTPAVLPPAAQPAAASAASS